jgi:hypothetical protein
MKKVFKPVGKERPGLTEGVPASPFERQKARKEAFLKEDEEFRKAQSAGKHGTGSKHKS